jgi:hypothetical protein
LNGILRVGGLEASIRDFDRDLKSAGKGRPVNFDCDSIRNGKKGISEYQF